MGAACGAGTIAEAPGPRKRSCTLGVTEEHVLDLSQQNPPKKTISEDSLRSDVEPDDAWLVGNRYQVQASSSKLREAPRADSSVAGEVRQGMIVVLLKVVEDEGIIWGFLDPTPHYRSPVGHKGPPCGWAILEGEECGDGDKPTLQKLVLCWEVGRVYKAREGTILRAGAELSSEKLGGLPKGEKVEVLELRLPEEGECKTRLRAKVLIWRTREVGWLSPRSGDGLHLLRDFKVLKLEMSGRLAQASSNVGRSSRGGA